jgi:hypothetical protein
MNIDAIIDGEMISFDPDVFRGFGVSPNRIVIVCEDNAAARRYAKENNIEIAVIIPNEKSIPRMAIFANRTGGWFDVILLTSDGSYFDKMSWDIVCSLSGMFNNKKLTEYKQ